MQPSNGHLILRRFQIQLLRISEPFYLDLPARLLSFSVGQGTVCLIEVHYVSTRVPGGVWSVALT